MAERRGRMWRLAGELSAIGLTLVIATAIGYFAGGWIGGRLGSPVWGGAIGGMLGVVAGFVEMFRTVIRYTREMEEEQRQGKDDV